MILKFSKLMAMVLAAALLLSGCNLVRVNKEKDDATIVAEYTGGTITKGEAIPIYDNYIQMYSQYGYSVSDPDTVRSIREFVLNTIAEDRIVALKSQELGVAELSDEEKADIEAEAQEEYSEYLEYYKLFMTGETDEEIQKAAEDFLRENGFTLEYIIDEKTHELTHEKLQQAVTADVTVTEEEIQAAYEDQVAADEATYSSDPYSFENAMANGESVAWMPEGYRTVKHILIAYTDEESSALQDLMYQLEDVNYELEQLDNPQEDTEDALEEEDVNLVEEDDLEEDEADAAGIVEEADAEPSEDAEPVAVPEPEDAEDEPEVENDFEEDVKEEPKSREELLATKAELEKQIEELKVQYLAKYQEKVDEILAKIDAGEDFESLIDEYGEDPGMQQGSASRESGYYVSSQSSMWDAAFTAGAMAIEEVGGVSKPVLSGSGIHIIRYEADVTPGAVPLEKIYDSVYETTLSSAKDTYYDEQVTSWVESANLTVYPDRMG